MLCAIQRAFKTVCVSGQVCEGLCRVKVHCHKGVDAPFGLTNRNSTLELVI